MAVITSGNFPRGIRAATTDTTSVYPVTVKAADLVATSFIKLGIIPAGFRVADFKLLCSTKLDSGGASVAMTADIGVLNGDGDGLVDGTTIAALTTTETGGTSFAVGVSKAGLLNAKNTSNNNQYLVMDVTAAAHTAAATADLVVALTIAPVA